MFPTQDSLHHLFSDEEDCQKFLISEGIFYTVDACFECSAGVILSGKLYRCKRKACRKAVSVYQGTVFAKSKIPCNKILHMAYLWLAGCSHKAIMLLTGHSKQAVTNFITIFQDLVGCAIDSDDTIIGGENVIVEIDESKFGKRKYNKGHRVEGVWVLGGVERTSNRLMFAEVVQKRDTKTLMEVISRHVASGSIVHTDLWKAYSQLEDQLNVQHRTVNHSKHFVNPVDDVHTNTIEGTWNGMKLKIAPRNRTKHEIQGGLLEFIWRRIHNDDLWSGFLQAMKQIKLE